MKLGLIQMHLTVFSYRKGQNSSFFFRPLTLLVSIMFCVMHSFPPGAWVVFYVRMLRIFDNFELPLFILYNSEKAADIS